MNGVFGPKEFNYFNVSREVKRMASSVLEQMGYKLVLITKSSNSPADSYLYRVMARKTRGRETYSVWTLSTVAGLEGLNNGVYDLDFKTAYKVFGEGLRYVESM